MTDTGEQRINLEDNSDQAGSDMADKQEQEQPKEGGEGQQQEGEQEQQKSDKEGGSTSP